MNSKKREMAVNPNRNLFLNLTNKFCCLSCTTINRKRRLTFWSKCNDSPNADTAADSWRCCHQDWDCWGEFYFWQHSCYTLNVLQGKHSQDTGFFETRANAHALHSCIINSELFRYVTIWIHVSVWRNKLLTQTDVQVHLQSFVFDFVCLA